MSIIKEKFDESQALAEQFKQLVESSLKLGVGFENLCVSTSESICISESRGECTSEHHKFE